jgi:hypothetical protein
MVFCLNKHLASQHTVTHAVTQKEPNAVQLP